MPKPLLKFSTWRCSSSSAASRPLNAQVKISGVWLTDQFQLRAASNAITPPPRYAPPSVIAAKGVIFQAALAEDQPGAANSATPMSAKSPAVRYVSFCVPGESMGFSSVSVAGSKV
jgi:hypothetical protein